MKSKSTTVQFQTRNDINIHRCTFLALCSLDMFGDFIRNSAKANSWSTESQCSPDNPLKQYYIPFEKRNNIKLCCENMHVSTLGKFVAVAILVWLVANVSRACYWRVTAVTGSVFRLYDSSVFFYVTVNWISGQEKQHKDVGLVHRNFIRDPFNILWHVMDQMNGSINKYLSE